MATQTVYQLHTALDGYKPKIWRRILVSTTMKLSSLAYMLMTLYEMEGSHLFNFYSQDNDEYYALKNGNLSLTILMMKIQKMQRPLLSKKSRYSQVKRLFLLITS